MRLSAPAMIVTLAASTGLPPLDTAVGRHRLGRDLVHL